MKPMRLPLSLFRLLSLLDWGRDHGAFVSRSLLTQAAPALHAFEHIEPSAGQLQSLRNLQATNATKWGCAGWRGYTPVSRAGWHCGHQ